MINSLEVVIIESSTVVTAIVFVGAIVDGIRTSVVAVSSRNMISSYDIAYSFFEEKLPQRLLLRVNC